MLKFREFVLNKQQSLKEQFLYEGGAYGRMYHPFEDIALSIQDIENMIEAAFSGTLPPVQEKVDGMNLMITFINGDLKIARKPSHIKNYGKEAITINDILEKYKGWEIYEYIEKSLRYLENEFKKIPKPRLNDFFKNGKVFLNLEIVIPELKNTIPYGLNMFVLHSLIEIDENGEVIKEDKPNELLSIIDRVKDAVNREFFIRGPNEIKIPKFDDADEQINKYKNRLKEIFGNSRSIEDYVIKKTEEEIKKEIPEIDNNILNSLARRISIGDKSLKMNDIKKFPFYEKWKSFEEKNSKIFKKVIEPVELLFLDLGINILKRIDSYLNLYPTRAVEKIKEEIQKIIEKVKNSENTEAIEKLSYELEKIKKLGGLDSVVPLEGIVFQYKDKIYKFTGIFSPINQIKGIPFKLKN